jgi:hypothetical protein
VPQLSRLTHFHSTTVYRLSSIVYRRLIQSLEFMMRHLRWMPHALSDAQKGERVNLSAWLLQMRMRLLKVQRDRAWYNMAWHGMAWHDMTSSSSTSFGFTWIRIMNSYGFDEMKIPERERHTIQSKKFILTIVLNPRGFHLIKVLEKDRKFNAGYYITEILKPQSHRAIKAIEP